MNDLPQDPWTRIESLSEKPGVTPEQMDEELRERRVLGPSIPKLIAMIVGLLIVLWFACYGAYRLLCSSLNLIP